MYMHVYRHIVNPIFYIDLTEMNDNMRYLLLEF